MFLALAQTALRNLLTQDSGLCTIFKYGDGSPFSIGRPGADVEKSVFFIQQEMSSFAIRLQVNGTVVSREVQRSRKFNKYWKKKVRFLESQGIHLAIGEHNQFYFSVVTRANFADPSALLEIEAKLLRVLHVETKKLHLSCVYQPVSVNSLRFQTEIQTEY